MTMPAVKENPGLFREKPVKPEKSKTWWCVMLIGNAAVTYLGTSLHQAAVAYEGPRCHGQGNNSNAAYDDCFQTAEAMKAALKL